MVLFVYLFIVIQSGMFVYFSGAKEIDIAATLEHIRDQRMNMVKTKVCLSFTWTN